MKTKKYKHLTFEDRCTIEEFLNYGYNFTQIGNRIHKDRTTISNEVKKHRLLRNDSNIICPITLKPPYVCNNCKKKNYCNKIQ